MIKLGRPLKSEDEANQGVIATIEYFGTQEAAAKALGVSQSTISLWLYEKCPFDRALEIERLTGGSIKIEQIIPELRQR